MIRRSPEHLVGDARSIPARGGNAIGQKAIAAVKTAVGGQHAALFVQESESAVGDFGSDPFNGQVENDDLILARFESKFVSLPGGIERSPKIDGQRCRLFKLFCCLLAD